MHRSRGSPRLGRRERRAGRKLKSGRGSVQARERASQYAMVVARCVVAVVLVLVL